MGGTYNPRNVYQDKDTGRNERLQMGFSVPFEYITSGYLFKASFDNPFTRFHESIEENPHFLDDIDDIEMCYTDNWERLKRF